MELRHNLCMSLVPYATLWYAFFLEIAIFRNLWCANSIQDHRTQSAPRS